MRIFHSIGLITIYEYVDQTRTEADDVVLCIACK